MARTPLLTSMIRALRRAKVAEDLGESPTVLTERAHSAEPSRRQILGAAVLAPLIMACRPMLRPSRQPVVAIVGGGMAGLLCAYRLQQAGVRATVYEASRRTGGRMYSARGKLAEGQLCELGGELVDSDHLTMHALAREFGLQLDDLTVGTEGLAADTFFFDGALVEEAELVARMRPLAQVLGSGIAAASSDENARAVLDKMSISTWLSAVAGLGETDLVRRILEVAYTIEFGLPADAQSSLNLLDMLVTDKLNPLVLFGDSDERYHFHDGNDAVPTAVAAALGESVATDHLLTRVASRNTGHALGFRTTNGDIEVVADHVVLALPFTMLRNVDLTDLTSLTPARHDMIDQLGYGTNAKLMLQFARRVWQEHGAIGGAYCDAPPLQSTWDSSRGQAGTAGVLTNFVGGARGLAMGDGTAEDRAREVLPWIDAVYPGAAAAYLPNSALRMHWPTQPFTRGSYSCYRPGQAMWAEQLGESIGSLHFAGEHTSVDFQGYMEGAAESGGRAAQEVLDAMGITSAAQA